MKRDVLKCVVFIYAVIAVVLLIAFALMDKYRLEIVLSLWIMTAILILGLLIYLIKLFGLSTRLRKPEDDVKHIK